jgi:hypothetical protein
VKVSDDIGCPATQGGTLGCSGHLRSLSVEISRYIQYRSAAKAYQRYTKKQDAEGSALSQAMSRITL